MTEADYFTAYEAIEKIAGLNSLSTLNKWTNFIQKECHYTFHLAYGKNACHKQIRHFSTEEIKKLQEVVYLIPKMGRDNALRTLFDVHHTYNTMNHQELAMAIFNSFQLHMEEKEKLITALSKQCHELNNQCMDLRQRIYTLEKLNDTEQDPPTSGWFRRKR